MTVPVPRCVACGQPCSQVYATTSWDVRRVPFANVVLDAQHLDPLILWLCTGCVNAAARTGGR